MIVGKNTTNFIGTLKTAKGIFSTLKTAKKA